MRTWALAAALVAAAATVFVGDSPALGDVVSLGAGRDNTLYSSTTGGRSNGAGSHFFAGVTAQGGTRRGLIAFDVSSIPAGATVNAATLTLHMSRTISTAEPVSVHRVLADWGEGASNANNEEGRGAIAQPGDATWIHRFYSGTLWTTPGGDFQSIASAATDIAGEGFYSWNSPQLAADVQSWLDGTSPNFGWLLMCNETYQGTAKRFDTKENPLAENRPVLLVDYTVVPEPAAALVSMAAGALMLRRRVPRAHRAPGYMGSVFTVSSYT